MIYHLVRSWALLSKGIVVSLGFFGLVGSAQAQLILHRTTVDLVDLDPGSDRWSASYSLDGVLPSPNQGFTIYFDAANFSDLSGPITSVGPEWDTLLIQPDISLSSPGFLDVASLASLPTFSGPFTIQFTLLSGGQPGLQDFEVYTLDPGFSIIQRGQVGAVAVPEPSALGGAAAFLLLAVVSYKTLRQRRPSRSAAAL